MTLEQLNEMYSQYTGLRIDIASLIDGAEDKEKVYKHLMWHLRKGRITERPADQEILEELVPALQEALEIEPEGEPSEIDIEETYTAEEAAAYNAQLPEAKTTNDWKVEPVEAQEAVEAQPAIYSFESYDSQAKTTKYGEGKVKVIEMRAGGATVEVTENTSTDPNAADFVGQQFNIATGLATEEPIQLYTLQNEPVDIWVTVALVSEAIEAQEAVEAVEGVKYTQEEADAYNATLDGAVKEGDKKN